MATATIRADTSLKPSVGTMLVLIATAMMMRYRQAPRMTPNSPRGGMDPDPLSFPR